MAKRESPGEVASPAAEKLDPSGFRRASFYDPTIRSALARDPVAQALMGTWRNRQQHGRIAYDQMMKHGSVAPTMRVLLNVIKSIRVSFTAPQEDPTPTQRDMADFLSAQLDRLPWTSIVDGWIGQAYQYGFNLAELVTEIRPWKNRPFVQVRELLPLPQGSLDDAFVYNDNGIPVSNTETTTFIPRYTCFDFDTRGRITGYWQYRLGPDDAKATGWTTEQDKQHILHFKQGGGDGNPFGESLLFPAFEAWASLYLLEALEQAHLENALPYITGSYEGDEPNPALHTAFETYVSEQDPTKRILIGNNMKFGKVTASDPDFVSHITLKKRELSDYITLSLLLPNSFYREAGMKDLDTRNLVQVVLKFTVPALMNAIGEVMREQFGKRLIDANYSNVDVSDYPRFRWKFVTPNDLRLATTLLQMILPHLDSEKLGEVFAEYLPGFEADFVAKNPEKSVGVVRQAAITAAGAEAAGENEPPTKEPGSERERIDGETENVGQATATEA